jgi:hypothetical protein
MIEDIDFLDPKTCKDLINEFEKYKFNHKLFYQRTKLEVLLINDSLLFKDIIKKYHIDNLYIQNFEIHRWPIGAKHDWHKDNRFYNYTSITYLNDDYIGGNTMVDKKIVVPKIGKRIKFDADVLHCVTELKEGVRYVIVCWYVNNLT